MRFLGSARDVLGHARDQLVRDHLGASGRQAREVRRGLRLPPLPRSRPGASGVWAVTMVKDEIDVLPAVLDHLRSQGVDHILVADNGSSDGTLEMLRERHAKGEVHLALDSVAAYYQDHKISRLARAAWRSGAAWVVPFDADEFWYAPSGTLAGYLRSVEETVLPADVFNVFPRSDGSYGFDPRPAQLGKVAFRAHRFAWVTQGNHTVRRPGRRSPADHRLRIAHLPWRSREQFTRKVTNGAAAYRGTGSGYAGRLGAHWTRAAALDEAQVGRLWDAIQTAQVPLPVDVGWAPSGPLHSVPALPWADWPEAPGEGR